MGESFSTAYLAAISTFYIKYDPYNTIQWMIYEKIMLGSNKFDK